MLGPVTRRSCLGMLVGTVPGVTCAQALQTGMVPKLRRGIGVHLPLNWPEVKQVDGKTVYAWPAFKGARFQLGDDDLRMLSAWGFDFVRLTLDPGIFMDAAGTERAAVLDGQAIALVQRFQAAGFSVIVDLHPIALNPVYSPRSLMAPGAAVFSSYGDLVERLAGVLNGLPHDKTVFELMNEPWIEAPADLPRWQVMLETLHRRARAAAPNLPLVLTGAMWSNWPGLVRLDTRPFQGSNVFYTFHYYDPHSFTHQGVPGDDAQFLAGVPWPMTAAEARGLVDAATRRVQSAPDLVGDASARATARTGQLVDALVRKGHGPAQVEKDFATVAAWGRSNGIEPERILLGEFGCVASARERPLGGDRLRWIENVRRAAESQRMPWAYWNFKGWGGMEMVSPQGKIDETVLAPLGLLR
ncbi:Cellulase (glycosyl hydrolase family 5) [Bosea lathyri]|uniref:Cellulase (Glycosyl hydrolase family 5) n=2 Tax=Bosea lathyri TaxID=1036778 RepID=A0A1H6BJP9_9HYPH|nr:Cellulase (glycosyl hydrolase family 5) [Bosea lathyri]